MPSSSRRSIHHCQKYIDYFLKYTIAEINTPTALAAHLTCRLLRARARRYASAVKCADFSFCWHITRSRCQQRNALRCCSDADGLKPFAPALPCAATFKTTSSAQREAAPDALIDHMISSASRSQAAAAAAFAMPYARRSTDTALFFIFRRGLPDIYGMAYVSASISSFPDTDVDPRYNFPALSRLRRMAQHAPRMLSRDELNRSIIGRFAIEIWRRFDVAPFDIATCALTTLVLLAGTPACAFLPSSYRDVSL